MPITGGAELWLRGTPRLLFSELFYLQGIGDRSAVLQEDQAPAVAAAVGSLAAAG